MPTSTSLLHSYWRHQKALLVYISASLIVCQRINSCLTVLCWLQCALMVHLPPLTALPCCNRAGKTVWQFVLPPDLLRVLCNLLSGILTGACHAFAADVRLNKDICRLLNDHPTQRGLVGLPIRYCSSRRETFCAYEVPPKVA